MKLKGIDKFEASKTLNDDFRLDLKFCKTKTSNESIKQYLLRCETNIGKTDYFEKRGLSQETIHKHRLGYDTQKKMVVIPYSGKMCYYQARSVVDKKFFKPPTNYAGVEPIYNENILSNYKYDEPIFIVESPICAMSIEQYNAHAIATCGGNGIAKLTEIFKNKKVKSRLSFILSFDNDDAGIKFTNELSEFLNKEKVKFITFNISGKFKDPNDCLQRNRDELIKGIESAKYQFYKQTTSYGDLVSAKDIMKMSFPETRWYVDKLFTKGVNLLCGASKSGKSWFVQQLCLAISSGKSMLGEKTLKSACWYMALEDDQELSQSRLRKMLKGGDVPENFFISYEIYPMDKIDKDKPTLIEYMEKNLKINPNIKVLVIDTFQKVRSSALMKESMFAHDYRDISAFKQLAERFNVCIIIVHHLNKMKDRDADGDPFAKINGTNGLMASADCIFLLNRKRDEDTATLSFTGRKICGDNWAIRQKPLDMRWEKIGTAEEEAKKKEFEEYDKDEYVKTIRLLLERNDGLWQGTCTKLLEECSRILGHAPAKDLHNTGKHLNLLTTKLKEYDNVIHLCPDKNGGNNGRIHSFYYADREQQKIKLN